MTTPPNTHLIRQNTSEKDDVCNAACVYFELTFWKIFNYNKLYRLCSLLYLICCVGSWLTELVYSSTLQHSAILYSVQPSPPMIWYILICYADGLNINIITTGLDFKQLTRLLHDKVKFYHLSILGDILTFSVGKNGFDQKCS